MDLPGRMKKRVQLFRNRDGNTGAGIAAYFRKPFLGGKHPEPTQFNPIPTSGSSRCATWPMNRCAGEPHFATPQHIKEAGIAAIQSNFTKYTAVSGTTELRDAIAHRHAVDFDSDYRR